MATFGIKTAGYTPQTPTTYTATNPAPRAGQGAYGSVPGAISAPSPFGDLSALYPNLSGANSQISSNIMNELTGQLSPSTINNIRNHAASFGVSSGMPGSDFSGYQGLANLGLTTEKLQGQGLMDYLNAITGISKTQTVDPALQTEIATQNSVWNAAPDPAAAAKEQQNLFDEYLKKTMSPAGGTVAGGGSSKPWWDNSGSPIYLGPGTKQIGPNTWSTPRYS